MMHLIRHRVVPVRFLDYPPNHILDPTPFDPDRYNDLSENGLKISPLKVIHSASVHYRGRYRKSASLRFINAFVELLSALSQHRQSPNLCLSDIESSEFKGRSSEVVGVGLCINLATKLFNVNYNRIIPIETSGKRCDFRLHKNGERYLLESKGRKNHSHMSSAIDDIFNKKSGNPLQLQYGFVSHLPRDGSPTSIIVVDPENQDAEAGRQEQVADLLDYYARYTSLSGFWRLADLIDRRVDAIRGKIPLSEFEDVPIDFENVYKFGRAFTITLGEDQFAFFRAKDTSIGFSKEYDNFVFFFALDRVLMDILIQQRFEDLMHYNFQTVDSDIESENKELLYSANIDGTILIGIPAGEFYNF